MKTIKIAHDPKTNLFMINYADLRSYLSIKILVDDKLIENPMNSPYIIFKEKPSKIEYVVTGNRTEGYIHTDGRTMTDDEYLSMRNQITKNSHWNDDTDEWSFNSVEDEVAYVRFKREWSRKYTTETKLESVNMEFIYHPVSEYPEITPMYLNGGNVFDTICHYSCNGAELFIKRCEELGLTKAKHANEKGLVYWLDHADNYRFAKLSGNYAVTDVDVQKYRQSARGSYDEMVTTHKSNIDKIDTIIRSFLARRNKEKLKETTIGDMISLLETINSRVHGISPVSKSRQSYYNLINLVETELKTLREISLNKSEE